MVDEYLKNSKSNSLSLAGSSTTTEASFTKFNLQGSNIGWAAIENCDGTEAYKEYLSKSKAESEKSQLDLTWRKAHLS